MTCQGVELALLRMGLSDIPWSDLLDVIWLSEVDRVCLKMQEAVLSQAGLMFWLVYRWQYSA